MVVGERGNSSDQDVGIFDSGKGLRAPKWPRSSRNSIQVVEDPDA